MPLFCLLSPLPPGAQAANRTLRTASEIRARLMHVYPNITIERDMITNPEILFKRALTGDQNSIQSNPSSLTPSEEFAMIYTREDRDSGLTVALKSAGDRLSGPTGAKQDLLLIKPTSGEPLIMGGEIISVTPISADIIQRSYSGVARTTSDAPLAHDTTLSNVTIFQNGRKQYISELTLRSQLFSQFFDVRSLVISNFEVLEPHEIHFTTGLAVAAPFDWKHIPSREDDVFILDPAVRVDEEYKPRYFSLLRT